MTSATSTTSAGSTPSWMRKTSESKRAPSWRARTWLTTPDSATEVPPGTARSVTTTSSSCTWPGRSRAKENVRGVASWVPSTRPTGRASPSPVTRGPPRLSNPAVHLGCPPRSASGAVLHGGCAGRAKTTPRRARNPLATRDDPWRHGRGRFGSPARGVPGPHGTRASRHHARADRYRRLHRELRPLEAPGGEGDRGRPALHGRDRLPGAREDRAGTVRQGTGPRRDGARRRPAPAHGGRRRGRLRAGRVLGRVARPVPQDSRHAARRQPDRKSV